MKVSFNTMLEKDIFRGHYYFDISVRHNNQNEFRRLSYSMSFTLDEIYKELKNKYKNKLYYIELIKI